jgi:peptide/nickel transport system substrate-binding protein
MGFITRLRTLIVVTACIGGSTIAHAQGDLRFRLLDEPESLYNVQLMAATANGIIGTYLTERLVYFDASGKPQPWLAESWTVSPDQTEVTFKLRSGIKFHDGTPFDAAAVKFQFDQVMDPQVASPVKSMIGPMKTVEVVDPQTVKFSFDKPYAPFFNNLAQASLGFNSPTAVRKFGKQYGRNPVGTGPYRLKSWAQGAEIVLERNPEYKQLRGDAVNKGAPIAPTVTLNLIPEEAVALAALETKELTSAILVGDAIQKVEKDPKLKLIVLKRATNIMYLEFNQNHAPFDDAAFRRAIGYAIDRDAVAKVAFSTYGSAALSPLASGIPGYSDEVAKKYGTPYDPAKARAMMAEAGWRAGPDGILQKDGKKAQFKMKTYSGFAYVERALAVVQNNLSDLGIKVEVEAADWGTFYPSLLKGDWDVALVRWGWSDAGVLSNLFRSPGHRKSLKPSPEQDAVLDRCNTTVDPDSRNTCVAEAQKLILANATMVPIFTNYTVIAAQPDVQDYTLDFFSYLIPGDVRVLK